MRKQVFGRKFKRDKNERKALFSGLISAMILRGRINTTEQKAKAVKSSLDKLVTKAKKKDARRLLQNDLKPFEIDKMINVIAPGFKNRKGGYTRIIRSGVRFNDNASIVIMEWSEMEAVEIKNEKSHLRQSFGGQANLKSEKTSVKKAVRKTVKKETK